MCTVHTPHPFNQAYKIPAKVLNLWRANRHPLWPDDSAHWDVTTTSIPVRFAEIVSCYPDRPALWTDRVRLTYRELDRRSDELAPVIFDRIGTGRCVALTYTDAVAEIIAMMAVYKTGNHYVFLPPKMPAARKLHLVKDSEASLVITDAADLYNLPMDSLDFAAIDINQLGIPNETKFPLLDVPSDALALIVYTSGTTGRPKGVAHTCRSLLTDAQLSSRLSQICPADIVAFVSSIGQLGLCWSLMSGLMTGACCVLVEADPERMQKLGELVKLTKPTIISRRVTARHLIERHPDERFPSVRHVMMGGDTIYRQDVEKCARCFPNALFTATMGSSEGGMLTANFVTDPDPQLNVVAVGYPLEGKQVRLLNEDGEPVKRGEIGEITIGSATLPDGYWRLPELSAQKFVSIGETHGHRRFLSGDLAFQLENGALVHAGRKDTQVSIRGQRVETSEIEGALLNIDGFSQAAVKLFETPAGDKRLAAHIAVDPAGRRSVSELRAMLATTLPDYMIPGVFLMYTRLPTTGTGKIDRSALPDPPPARPDLDAPYCAPCTPVESILAEIWCAVLELDRVGIHDPFLELGGHSLMAMQIATRVRDQFQWDGPLTALLENATIAQMAIKIVTWHADEAELDFSQQPK